MKKTSKIFLIISGIYLLLLSILLLSQPKSGYHQSIFQILLNYLFFMPLIGLMILIKKRAKNIFQKKSILVLYLIILLVLIGFIFNLDYQRRIGCFVENENFLSINKFILSGVSIVLLLTSNYYRHYKFGLFC